MPIKKTIVVLAKSIKHNQYCVAGKDINSKEWIRPVSDVNGAELSEQQSKCTNNDWQNKGKLPYNSKVLQKLEINFLQHAPLPNQPENYVVSEDIWQQKYQISEQDLQNYLDEPESLWGDGDRIEYSQIENSIIPIGQSLYLVKVQDGALYKNEDKRRVSFSYKRVVLTPLKYERQNNNQF